MTDHAQTAANWDQRYLSGDAPWNSGLVSRELVRVLRDERVLPCQAVDLGCGTGTNAVYLAQSGFGVLATDCSMIAIDRTRVLADEAGTSLQTAVADLSCLSDLRRALGPTEEKHERRCSFLFDRGCYHCARRTNLAGFQETVVWLAAPNARLLLLCGNANEPSEQGPPKLQEFEIRDDWERLFDIEWIRSFRFEDRGGISGPLGWACWMTRCSAG